MDFDVIRATVLALIQGLTEFLPVSSSAHLILPSELLGWADQGLNFDMALHMGSLVAVLVYFRKDLLTVATAMLTHMVKKQPSVESKLGWFIILATIPVTVAGLLFEDVVETQMRSVNVIIVTTLFYGLLLGIADRRAKQTRGMEDLDWKTSLIIGLAQMMAIIPGTSRSGVTMTAALFCGLRRDVAARFSFLLSIPTIGGAALLKLIELLESPAINWHELLYAMTIAALTAYLCIHYFLKLIARISFMPFVVYRLLLGVVLLVFFALPSEAQTMYVKDQRSANPDKIVIQVDQATLDDLDYRLTHTRWPMDMANDDWAYGTNRDYLQELVEYWATDYDWQAQQQWLNNFNHYRTMIDGVGIHYIHQRSTDPEAIPVLLLHGWPGSFVQMLKLVPLLTDPVAHGLPNTPSFHVVVASLPGFGFSDAPQAPGMNLEGFAELMAKLMHDKLGYQQYGVRGGDIGGATIDQMARHYPDQLLGAHLTQIIVAGGAPAQDKATDAERAFLTASAALANNELSYSRQHASKPQTLAYGLTDSPAGLAGWIVEKYRTWGDTKGNIESRFDKDFLITTLMSYWLSSNIGPSVRTYYEMVRNRGNTNRIDVPVAFLMSKNDMFPPAPREWAERSHNVVHFSETATGGHFLEWEEPELVARDMQEFFGKLASANQ
ncbi:MAG: undecaprenyl-diphosphate phosphatase [Pseudomonadota bacterium]